MNSQPAWPFPSETQTFFNSYGNTANWAEREAQSADRLFTLADLKLELVPLDLPKVDIDVDFVPLLNKTGLQSFSKDVINLTKQESDPSGRAFSEPGTKADYGKDLPWLFQTGFANALAEVVKVTTLGAQKYTPNGWATVENGSERYMEGFARHMSKLAQGETFDNGPGGIGTHHKAQMIWNLLASLELELREQNK